jgi:hypothetical protein
MRPMKNTKILFRSLRLAGSLALVALALCLVQ